jgi:outer membrane protein OmpA-like peptidoglycan-associated protein
VTCVKKYRNILIALFLVHFSVLVHAQFGKKRITSASIVIARDSLTSYSQSDIFTFPNVNKISYYENFDHVKEIRKLDKLGKEEELYPKLRTYVKNFGIENFRKNADALGRLARLSLKYGPKGEAILLYKLIVKHHQPNTQNYLALLKEYDSLETDKKKYYAPIEFYYELIKFRKEIDTLKTPTDILLNMGEEVNSLKEDYGPVVGNNDSILLFTSKRNKGKGKKYDEDLFISKKVDDRWTAAVELKAVNTVYNEGSACISNNGKKLYFSRCNAPKGMGDCDLYEATLKKNGTWGSIKNLGNKVNSTAWDSQPSLAHKGDTLYFSSSRLGGFGQTDIYYSTKDKKGAWQKAKNLGPIINTRGDDVSPFYHHRHHVLYFSSNAHPLNFGQFDIYKSKFTRKGNWTEPRNIGPLVNGSGSEYYFTIDAKSSNLYYARSEESDFKNLDLFSFPLPMEAQPLATASLKGVIKNSKTGQPETGIASVIDLDQGVEVAPKFLREDGSFDFSLINKRNYLLIIQGDDFFRIEEKFFLQGDTTLNKQAEPINQRIEFKTIEFENGKANILPAMHHDLGKLAIFLVDHPKVKLNIIGHTDSQGKEEENLKLSQDRAIAIKAYLMQEYKLTNDRIDALGVGSSKPIISEEKTEADRQINRRVEFNIISR